MTVQVEKVSTQDIQLGMYVSQLDRPWIETPFPVQGFHIRTQDDAQKLRVWCRHVYIDRNLSKHDPAPALQTSQKPDAGRKKPVRGTVGKFSPVEYQVARPVTREVAAAAPYYKEIVRAMAHLLKDVRAGKGVNLRVARKAASVMVHSILRNPDAMVWLARVKDKDSYAYAHSIRCAILATVFGRHIGLPQDVLENLATGVLLMDVGKLQVPGHLLTKPEKLTTTEMRAMRRHVNYGVQLLQGQSGINDQMLGVVQYHHERHDGTGYPEGLSGAQIPLLARIAGIVDTYDAITSPRAWARAKSSNEAVSMLYELRNKTFHGELVEQFIQSIGVYPTGTPVKLSNEAVGVVVCQNPSRRLRPQVMVLQNARGEALSKPRILDPMKVDQDEAGRKLSISGGVSPEACQVNLAQVELGAAA